MVTDVELSESGWRSMSSHERRNIGGHNTGRYQPIRSLTNESDRISLS